ncbi:hypothetical protein ANANG_G00114310 [Anguilla anguilla]|uniref:Uncharacterized protein n=1 Tax=Anguilla anguilla TaxID=7936 RepID=A0A9D3MCC9_ANGAN|nr:hypothetical protein ANANG_G00114310 [Anguilla anguilla]
MLARFFFRRDGKTCFSGGDAVSRPTSPTHLICTGFLSQGATARRLSQSEWNELRPFFRE